MKVLIFNHLRAKKDHALEQAQVAIDSDNVQTAMDWCEHAANMFRKQWNVW